MTLNYNLLLTLKEMALRRVVITLWNKTAVLSQIDIGDTGSGRRRTRATFGKDVNLVKTVVSELDLPETLKEKAIPLIDIVSLEILRWLNFHLDLFTFPQESCERKEFMYLAFKFDSVLKKLLWTSIGTVNYRKTAREIISLKLLDNVLDYKLACMYCLEDQVPVLWKELPDIKKWQFHAKEAYFQTTQSLLDDFWTTILIENFSMSSDAPEEPFDSTALFYQHAFELSANMGNKSATEYFYEKLTGEKQATLFETAKEVATKEQTISTYATFDLAERKYTDVLCYLLSQMTPEKQMQLFQEHPFPVLSCFVVWPWQDLFSEVAQRTLEFLPENSFHDLLKNIWTKIMSRSIKVDLYKEVFRLSPECLKNYFIELECLHEHFLYNLFVEGYIESIFDVFRSIEAAAKVRLALCDQGHSICHYLIKNDKWRLLKLFIRETKLSKEDGEKLKGDLMSFVSESFDETELSYKFKECDDCFC